MEGKGGQRWQAEERVAYGEEKVVGGEEKEA